MKRVILESPYAGDIAANVEYARKCMLNSLTKGESPMVSHLLYTQVLNDADPTDRLLGIEVGLAWRDAADYSVVYYDRGISSGMKYGIRLSSMIKPVVFRSVYESGEIHDVGY